MQIRQLTAYVVRLPLRKPFRHASAVRQHSDNLFIRCELTSGQVGWGEGVPRSYVTGETADGALEQFAATPLPEQLAGEVSDWPTAIELCRRLEPAAMRDDPRGCYGNSLRCAVELSILDAAGQLFGEPLRNMFHHLPAADGIRAPRDQVQYSTALDAQTPQRLARSALKMRLYGFRQCKMKVGVDIATGTGDDAARLAIVRRWIGRRMDLRVDANEAWRPDEVVERVAALRPFNITAVEQPLPHRELAALGELRRQIGIPVMLDESLTSMVDAEQAVLLDACDLFNLRLSKCGGLIRCVELANYARRHDFGYQLGCHPGESAILSAAGRHFATAIGGLRYLEGSYDRHVLAQQFTIQHHTFGYGGRAAALHGPGLGAALDVARARGVILAKQEWVF